MTFFCSTSDALFVTLLVRCVVQLELVDAVNSIVFGPDAFRKVLFIFLTAQLLIMFRFLLMYELLNSKKSSERLLVNFLTLNIENVNEMLQTAHLGFKAFSKACCLYTGCSQLVE